MVAVILKVGPNPERVVAHEKIELRRDIQGEKNAPKYRQSYSGRAPSLQCLVPRRINLIPEWQDHSGRLNHRIVLNKGAYVSIDRRRAKRYGVYLN
jgi:hypothetical protein